jgi:hypothetical protein
MLHVAGHPFVLAEGEDAQAFPLLEGQLLGSSSRD